MDIGRIVLGCIVGLIAISLGIYVSFTARGKGPIFSNAYIWTSKDERKKIDKKAEYKLVTVIFGCLTAIFILLALNIFTLCKWSYILMWFLIVFVIVYAIIDVIKSEKQK